MQQSVNISGNINVRKNDFILTKPKCIENKTLNFKKQLRITIFGKTLIFDVMYFFLEK